MSCPAVCATGPCCPHPVMRAKISGGLTAAQSSGPMPSRSQVPGRKQSSSTSALATNSNSACGWVLTSKSTIRFPRCSRSRSSVGIISPPGRRTRTTSAPKSASTIAACGPGPMPPSSMTRTPASGPALLTTTSPLLRLQPLLHFQHLLAQLLGRGIDRPLDGALEYEAGEWNVRVDPDLHLDQGGLSLRATLWHQGVLAVLRLLLAGAHQRPGHLIAAPGVGHHLFVGDASGPDLHLDFAGPAVLSGLEDFRALMRFRPLRHRFEVGDDVQDFLGACFDDDVAGFVDCHVRTIARRRRAEGVFDRRRVPSSW